MKGSSIFEMSYADNSTQLGLKVHEKADKNEIYACCLGSNCPRQGRFQLKTTIWLFVTCVFLKPKSIKGGLENTHVV